MSILTEQQRDQLKAYKERVTKELYDNELKFWLENSVDYECGGYFNCLDRDGQFYDTTKHIWLQGRQVWMLSKLFNTVEDCRTRAILEAARCGAEFLRKYAKADNNRVYFSLTREGKPTFIQRKIFSECFYVMAMAEFSKASGSEEYFEEAVDVFGSVISFSRDPAVLGRPVFEATSNTSALAVPMILLNVIDQLRSVDSDGQRTSTFDEEAEWCKREIIKHINFEKKLVFENVNNDGTFDMSTPEGRLINPGHAIEAGWFLMDYAVKQNDAPLIDTAKKIIEWMYEYGRDPQYGGVLYFKDAGGYDPIQLEWSMKLWWVHCEAMVAMLMAARESIKAKNRDETAKFLALFDEVYQYSLTHYVDKEHGGWFGYCDREGKLTHRFKGGPYKGFFHVPRALWMCENLINEILNLEQQS